MTGAYRRGVLVRAKGRRAVCDVEDDFHRFTVALTHDGRRVTAVEGEAIRHPWTMCVLAGQALEALRGMALTTDPAAIYAQTDPRAQCTHQLEMAGLAVCQAARGPGERRYDVMVGDAVDGRRTARLSRDGELLFDWTLVDGLVEAGPYAGRRPQDFGRKAVADLPHDEAEALLVLRRAVAASLGRQIDVDAFPNAGAMNRGAACFVYRPGIAEGALRVRGSIREFTEAAPPLCAAPKEQP